MGDGSLRGVDGLGGGLPRARPWPQWHVNLILILRCRRSRRSTSCRRPSVPRLGPLDAIICRGGRLLWWRLRGQRGDCVVIVVGRLLCAALRSITRDALGRGGGEVGHGAFWLGGGGFWRAWSVACVPARRIDDGFGGRVQPYSRVVRQGSGNGREGCEMGARRAASPQRLGRDVLKGGEGGCVVVRTRRIVGLSHENRSEEWGGMGVWSAAGKGD